MSEAVNPNSSRRRIWMAAAVVALAAIGIGLWYGWLWYARPAPPDVPLDGVEPAVAQAIQTAREKVLKESRSAAAWGELGKVLRAHDFFGPSDVCFARAERLDPNEPRWPYYQGLSASARDPEAAAPFFRRAAELADRYDRGDGGPRLRLAETLLQTEAYAEAEDQLNRVLSWDPNNVRVHYDLGVLAVARQDDVNAVGHYLISLASPFARQKSCAALAALRLRQGDAAGAAEYGRQGAAAPEDQSWDDRYIEEYLRLEVGRRGRYQRAERLEAEGRLEDALPILLGLAEDASDARAHIAAGMALYKLGRLEEAEHYFRAAVGRGGEQTEANYSLAVVLVSEGMRIEQGPAEGPDAVRAKNREAVGCADKALDLKPDHALAHHYRGLALKGLGQRKEAIESFRQAALRRPELVEPHQELARALDEDGRKAEAVVEWRHVVEAAAAEDPRRREALERVQAADAGPR